MERVRYSWSTGGGEHVLELVRVRGTNGQPYPFGSPAGAHPVDLRDFYLATIPVTQALWIHVMGESNPSHHRGPELPLENVSWSQLTQPGGFLDRINESAIANAVLRGLPRNRFRLPTETEWEYAARGGPDWRDGFLYSGSDDVDAVAWYDRRHGDHTQPVGQKAPNQLGIHDMSGNVWEWCQDVFTPDIQRIPRDGTACVEAGDERVLRGGCFHNWAIHCMVSKRYEIAHDFHDGCIGVRLAIQIGMNGER